MASKKTRQFGKQRSDAERRARQSERLSRLFRVFGCIMGAGRWDAKALARELEVSERTVHRLMQTLSMAGVPWYFCKDNLCYRVRAGFRFPGLEIKVVGKSALDPLPTFAAAKKVLAMGDEFLTALREFCAALERGNSPLS